MPAVGSSAGAGAAAGDGGPSICEVGGGGNLLPLFGDAEQTWPKALRSILYLIGLGWCFCGVALISEVFMGAIETITSQKKRKMNRETGRMITVCVWNPTVANLTLMALGSSAPEILLSVIELLGNSFFGGELGPSTIVGSAAFNLLCITAVCVVTIPDKEVRRIKEMSVYAVTSAFSIFAYLWLLVILMGFSKDVIEIWEGVLTFLFFPMLVGLAYVADQGYFSRIPNFGGGRQKIIVDADMSKEELAELEAAIRRKHGSDLTDEQVARLISAEHEPPPSRAAYRVQAIRGMTGGKRVNTPCQVDTAVPPLNSIVPFEGGELPARRSDSASFDVSFEFEAVRHAVLESVGDLALPITRLGNEDVHASVAVRTRDGTAKSNQDYMPIDTRVKFPPGVTKQTVTLSIVDDNETEENEEFYVELHEAQAVNCTACVGRIASTTIVIIDDDLPGTLEFQDDSWTIVQDAEDKVIEVIVQRKGGGNGKVSCRYCTEDGTAISPADFERAEGTVEFEHGQMVSVIPVKIKGAGRYERSENFRVVLSEPCGGAKLDPKSDGGAESTILTVIIKSEHTTKARIDKLWATMSVNWDRTQVGHRNWKEQFVSALYANGGGDTEETQSDPTLFDHIVHGVLLPWKLLFALVPPTDYMNGWVCFCVSLLFIGGLTAVIGDMANLLGCVLHIPSEITAITFVALGTSLPDTFASKQAALQATHADASIGNITGSNSVNVFLGLGLPWMMASIYWTVSGPNDEWRRRYGSLPAGRAWPNGAFVVPADGLGFSVLVFSGCAILCVAVLYLRRRYAGGELGGSVNTKFATAFLFVGLWLTYIGLSAWYIMNRK